MGGGVDFCSLFFWVQSQKSAGKGLVLEGKELCRHFDDCWLSKKHTLGFPADGSKKIITDKRKRGQKKKKKKGGFCCWFGSG